MKLSSLKEIWQRKDRSARYARNSAMIIAAKAVTVLANLLLVPMALNYLGVEEYGVWIALTTFVGWFSFFDLGLGHGLRNKYAHTKATGQSDEARKYVSTAFFVLLAISVGVFLLYLAAAPFIDWAALLNASPALEGQLSALALFVVGMFCVRLTVNIVSIMQTADQHPGVPAWIVAGGNVLSLAAVYLVTRFCEPSVLYLGIALTVSQLFPLLVAFVVCFAGGYRPYLPSPAHFSKTHIRSIFSLGARFFLIQVTALVLFQSNNVIIAHTAGLEQVSEFNIAYKYLSVLYVVFSAAVTPFWSATTEAYAKGDAGWIHKNVKRLNRLWGLLIVLGLVMILAAPLVYRLWLRDTVLPDTLLLGLLFAYFACLGRSFLYRNFMNGVGKISLQFYVTLVQSALHIPLAILAGKAWGMYGVVCVMILWAFTNALWEPVQFAEIINNKAKGVWNK